MKKIVLLLILFFTSLVILPQDSVASSKIILQEDFNDGNYDGWDIVRNTCKYNGQPSKWKVVDGKVGSATNSVKQCYSELVPNDSLWNTTHNDYIVEFDMTLVRGTDHMAAYHYSSPNAWYDFHVQSPSTLSVSDNKHFGNYSNGQTIRFKIIVKGRSVQIYRDGSLVINDQELYEDYPTGKFALMLYAGEDIVSETYYDNIVVTELTDDPVLAVPLLMQVNQEWSDDPYDHINTSIADSGCAMVSTAMILNYHKIHVLPNGLILTPRTLNQWLTNHYDEDGYGGYLRNGSINWQAISALSKNPMTKVYNPFFEKDGLELSWPKDPTDEDVITDLKNERPVIIHVNNESHFVVATGVEEDTFLINDPLYATPKKLTDNYNGQYQSIRRYVPSDTDVSYIVLAIEDSINIIVKDSAGNEVGIQQIEQPVKNTNGEIEFVSYPLKTVYIPKPETDEYTISLSADNTQNYLLDIYTYDIGGKLKKSSIGGLVKNQQETITINFDKDHAERSTSLKDVTFQSTIDDVNEAVALRLVNKGLGKSIVALLKSAEKDVNKNKRMSAFVAEKKLDVIGKLLDKSNGKKYLLDEEAYQILKYDIEQLRLSLDK